MEKLKLLQQACDLFKRGKFNQCQQELEKCCNQEVTPLQWVLKNNHLVSKSFCQSCEKEVKNELKYLLFQVKGIPPSRQVLPVELALTFNHYLLLFKQYQCNEDLVSVKTVIESINSTWLRVCRASDVSVSDAENCDYLCCFVKAISCSLSNADLLTPVLLLGCLQSVCHLACGDIDEAYTILAVVNKNMPVMMQQKYVQFIFLQNFQSRCTTETRTNKESIGDSHCVHACKVLHAVVHSVKKKDLNSVMSLVKSSQLGSPLYLSTWYWSMYSLYLEEQYNEVTNGISAMVSGKKLTTRDRSIATNLLACTLMKQNKGTAAIALLRQCLQDEFSYLLPLYNLALMYGKQGQVAAKLETLHLLTMALHQQNAPLLKPEPTLVLKTTHQKSKQMIVVKNVVEQRPSHLLVFYKLAKSCFNAARFSDAADHYLDLLSSLNDTSFESNNSGIVEDNLPSLITIYFEAALAQVKSRRLSDALLIINKLQEKLPHPPVYKSDPGQLDLRSKDEVTEEVLEEVPGKSDGVFTTMKRPRMMSNHQQSDVSLNDAFYSYVKISLLKVFCLVACRQNESALQCVDTVLDHLEKCPVKGISHTSKRRKLDQDMHTCLNQSGDPILRLKAETYNNKAIILIGQNRLQEANELLLNGIHCCPGFVDVVYNHTLLLIKLCNQSAASDNWIQFRFANVVLNTSVISHLLSKNASSLKNARSSISSPGEIPQFNLFMMDKFALEFKLKADKK
ncbi:uncharacterized protein [Antedon mediterranea]|uniref:uncharacterized protein n=1 Tax=Antedon mediterranea TaxID=105859 RepID=UPI003AF42581